MNKTTYTVVDLECILYSCDNVRCLLIQPVDEHDLELLDEQVKYIADEVGETFALAAFKVRDWNKELSPWEAEAVFGKQPFTGGAKETLEFVKQHFLPDALSRCGIDTNITHSNIPVIIGGYSLAALFALWCGYTSNGFAAIAAASPSVWFPSWSDFMKINDIKAGSVYLSLGDKEEKTRNKTMAKVGDCIREQFEILKEYYRDKTDIESYKNSDAGIGSEENNDGGIESEENSDVGIGSEENNAVGNDAESTMRVMLDWNEGNHFRDSHIRTAKAFVWCVKSL